MLKEADFRARLVVPRHHFVEDGEVAGLFDVGHGAEDEPHRVVVETASDVVVAPFCERLVLVVASSVGELCGCDVDDALSSARRNLMYEAYEVLVAVAEAHTAAYSALEEAGGTREVECHHALVLVPDVHHSVQFLVSALHAVAVQQVVPVAAELVEGLVHLFHGAELADGFLCLYLIYNGTVELSERSDETFRWFCVLFFLRHLHVTEQEYEAFLFAWLQFHFHIVRGNGAPSVSDGVLRLSVHDHIGVGKLVVQSDERLPVGVEALYGSVDMVESKVVAALLVLCFVVDGGAVNLHFAGREVALEVLHVRGCIPQTPFGEREQLQLLHFGRGVFQRELLHFAPFLQRNEKEHRGFYAVLAACDARVAHAVAALVAVERCLAGFPAWVPHCSVVVDIEVSSAVVHRDAVVTVAGDASELCILEEGVATCCVRNQHGVFGSVMTYSR